MRIRNRDVDTNHRTVHKFKVAQRAMERAILFVSLSKRNNSMERLTCDRRTDGKETKKVDGRKGTARPGIVGAPWG